MVRRVVSICALVAAIASVAGVASAEEWDRGNRTARADDRGEVKDCTRFNGRWGYYGNPWCTPEEQARWDRWSSRKH